jgi:hypothetical protein
MKVIPETYMMKVIPETYLMKVIPETYLMKVIPETRFYFNLILCLMVVCVVIFYSAVVF